MERNIRVSTNIVEAENFVIQRVETSTYLSVEDALAQETEKLSRLKERMYSVAAPAVVLTATGIGILIDGIAQENYTQTIIGVALIINGIQLVTHADKIRESVYENFAKVATIQEHIDNRSREIDVE